MSDIYAEFGVNNAVMSGAVSQEEHEQNMLALDVRARDGDSSIELEGDLDEEDGLADETDEEENTDEDQDDEGADSDDDEPATDPDEEAEGDDLETTAANLSKYADGFAHMREQAIANGLSAEMASLIEAEYETDKGISDSSYAALEKAGYSRGFVESYIQGQEAVTEQYVAKIVDLAGGQTQFQRVMKHLETSSPDSVDSLYEAIERQDLKSIRSIITLGSQSLTKKFGKAPARNVTKAAPAIAPQRKAAAVSGYESSADMIKDMGSSKYRHDPKFRAQVEARVAASSF